MCVRLCIVYRATRASGLDSMVLKFWVPYPLLLVLGPSINFITTAVRVFFVAANCSADGFIAEGCFCCPAIKASGIMAARASDESMSTLKNARFWARGCAVNLPLLLCSLKGNQVFPLRQTTAVKPHCIRVQMGN